MVVGSLISAGILDRAFVRQGKKTSLDEARELLLDAFVQFDRWLSV